MSAGWERPPITLENVCLTRGSGACLFGSCRGNNTSLPHPAARTTRPIPTLVCVCNDGFSHSTNWLRMQNCGIPDWLPWTLAALNVFAGMVAQVLLVIYFAHLLCTNPRRNAAARLVQSLAILLCVSTLCSFAFIVEGYGSLVYVGAFALEGIALGAEVYVFLDVVWGIVKGVVVFSESQRLAMRVALVLCGLTAGVPMMIALSKVVALGDPTSPSFDVHTFNQAFALGFGFLSMHLVVSSIVFFTLYFIARREIDFVIGQRRDSESERDAVIRTQFLDLRRRLNFFARAMAYLTPAQTTLLVLIPVSYERGWPIVDLLIYTVFGNLNLGICAALFVVRGKRRFFMASEGGGPSVGEEGVWRTSGARGAQTNEAGAVSRARLHAKREISGKRGGAVVGEAHRDEEKDDHRSDERSWGLSALDQLGIMDGSGLSAGDVEALLNSSASDRPSHSSTSESELPAAHRRDSDDGFSSSPARQGTEEFAHGTNAGGVSSFSRQRRRQQVRGQEQQHHQGEWHSEVDTGMSGF